MRESDQRVVVVLHPREHVASITTHGVEVLDERELADLGGVGGEHLDSRWPESCADLPHTARTDKLLQDQIGK